MAVVTIFEDVLKTLTNRLKGAVVLDSKEAPVLVEFPDPDYIQSRRPCIGIWWYDLVRNLTFNVQGGKLIEKDMQNMTATVEPYPEMWDMHLQFSLYAQSSLHDVRGFAQLLRKLRALASRELRTDILNEKIWLRHIAVFRDNDGRDFHSGARYAVTVPLRLDELKQEYPLVQKVIFNLYREPKLQNLDKILEV